MILTNEPHFAETAGDQVCPFEPAEETSTGFQFIGLVTDRLSITQDDAGEG